MEIITALVIPMEVGKKFKKEDLINIIQTHLNTHPMLKDNPRFSGLFGGHGHRQQGSGTDKENPVTNTSMPSAHADMHCQHPSQSAPLMAMSQPLIPSSHVNFTIPGASTSSHPFTSVTPLSASHSLSAHYYPSTIPLTPSHGANYYSH